MIPRVSAMRRRTHTFLFLLPHSHSTASGSGPLSAFFGSVSHTCDRVKHLLLSTLTRRKKATWPNSYGSVCVCACWRRRWRHSGVRGAERGGPWIFTLPAHVRAHMHPQGISYHISRMTVWPASSLISCQSSAAPSHSANNSSLSREKKKSSQLQFHRGAPALWDTLMYLQEHFGTV